MAGDRAEGETCLYAVCIVDGGPSVLCGSVFLATS